MRLFNDTTEVATFGVEVVTNKKIFGVYYVAVCFGHHTIGIEWGSKKDKNNG